MIFAQRNNKIPDFYMIFARKIPKFFIIIARKIFQNFRGHVPCPPMVTVQGQNHYTKNRPVIARLWFEISTKVGSPTDIVLG